MPFHKSDMQRHFYTALEKLIKPDMLAKVAAEGREGRVVRVQFKNDSDMMFNHFLK